MKICSVRFYTSQIMSCTAYSHPSLIPRTITLSDYMSDYLSCLTDCRFIIQMLFHQVYWQYFVRYTFSYFVVLQLCSDSYSINGYVCGCQASIAAASSVCQLGWQVGRRVREWHGAWAGETNKQPWLSQQPSIIVVVVVIISSCSSQRRGRLCSRRRITYRCRLVSVTPVVVI